MFCFFFLVKILIINFFFRDARSLDKYQIGIITKDSVDVQNHVLKSRWEVAKLVQGYE